MKTNFEKSIDHLARVGRVGKKYEIFLNLTYQCPLRCTYCYVDYNKAPPMTQEQVDYVIDKLIIKPVKPFIKLVTFFGGEPALQMDIIENTIRKYYNHPRIRNVHFGIITSFAVNQQRLLDLQKEFPLLEIVISHDVDNSQRVTLAGKPFDVISRSEQKGIDLEIIASHRRNIIFNKIVTGNETSLYDDLMWLHDTYKRHGIVYSWGFTKTPKFENHSKGRLAVELAKYLQQIVRDYLNTPNGYIPQVVFQYLYRYLKFRQENVIPGCGINSEFFIDSSGTVSPCSISHHLTDLKIIDEGKYLDSFEEIALLEQGYYDNPTCTQCDLRGFCPGGCLVFRFQEHQNYNIPNEGQCILMSEVHLAFEKLLNTLTPRETEELVSKSIGDMSKFYEYCTDNSSHIDMYDIIDPRGEEKKQ